MSLNPNATATLVFGGLALCHYNEHTDLWEVLFIRDEENLHDLKIVIGYGTPSPTEIPVDFGDAIIVNVTNPKSTSSTYLPSEDFTRTIGVDNSEDMRWTLNFSSDEMHGHPLTISRRERDNFLTVPNALFYTFQWSNRTYELQKKVNGNNDGDPVPLAAIGEYYAGDIECNSGGSVSIDIIKPDGEISHYDLDDKTTVFFNNICDQTDPKCASDFPHYYDVLSDNGVTFDLVSELSAEKMLESFKLRGQNYSCEGAWDGGVIPNPPGTLNEPAFEP